MVLQTLATLGPLPWLRDNRTTGASVRRGAGAPYLGTLYPGLMRLEQRGLVR